jgi:hypothetical protein
MGEELHMLLSNVQNLKENERHLANVLNSERQNAESKTKALRKCECVLKAVTDNNDDMKQENTSLHMQVVTIY